MIGFRAFQACLCLALLSAPTPALQEPKMGKDWYQDDVDLGFKVKAPRDWEFVPGSPLERNLIGKYSAGNGQFINLGKEAFVMVQICLVKFDRRPEADKKEKRQVGDKTVEFAVKGLQDLADWMSRGLDEGRDWHLIEEAQPLKGQMTGTYAIYEGLSNRGRQDAESQPVRAYAALFELSPEIEIALVGLGPGEDKKWRTFEKAYKGFAKTIQPVEVTRLAGGTGKDPRSIKRAKLEEEVAKSPGWSLHETPNYFIVSCYDDKQFIEEMKLRLEGIRAVYEKDYPPELARKIKADSAATSDGEGGKKSKEEEDPDPNRTIAAIDTLELGRSSVVRLCKDRDQYLSYGAPANSSGYFSSLEQELVVFDDKENKGRDATWAVLNHEGFHQYTYAFFGNLAPHSWYNEGTGDYYSGFSFNKKTKKFKAEKSIGRQDNLLLIRDRYVRLENFVRWTKAQYYGSNEANLEGWACYAQGWSLIYFLREGEKAKGWKKEYGGILEKYVDTLLGTGDLDQAVDSAFEGIDWQAFEDCWRNFMM